MVGTQVGRKTYVEADRGDSTKRPQPHLAFSVSPWFQVHVAFPRPFKGLVEFFLMIKPQDNCPLSWMSNDILFYILNMCRWDWVPPGPRLQAQLEAEREEAEQVR